MFGKRPDGSRIKGIDPMVQFTPYIMPKRYDAMVNEKQDLDFDAMTHYIRDKRRTGQDMSYMTIFIAAYLRMICDFPEMNRFIANKKLYGRNHFCVSFVSLSKREDDTIEESLNKVTFDLNDTIFDVHKRLTDVIERARHPEDVNLTDKLARFLLKVPGLPSFVVWTARRLDNHGIMPKFIHDASPFHTSLFVSNLASLGMNYVYHHIYDFGTTSMFVVMGKPEQRLTRNSDGTCRSRRVMPVGVTIDERIAAGAMFGRMFTVVLNYLNDPTQLEKPPEHIRTEVKMQKAPPVPKVS